LRLGFKTRNQVARLAIGRSLSVDAPPSPVDGEPGKGIKGFNLFGGDLRTWIALIVQRTGIAVPTLAAVQDAVRRHWTRGIYLLQKEWEQVDGVYEEFLRLLSAKAAISAEGIGPARGEVVGEATTSGGKAGPVRIGIGEVSINVATGEVVEWLVNGPGTAPHFAVMGAVGTGKTRTGMAMLRSIRRQSGCPVLIFDMGKGDLANDRRLAESFEAQVVDPLRTPIPLDVLYVQSQSRSDVLSAAMRFRESFARVPSSRLGGAQIDLLREAAVRALMNRKGPVRIADVRDRLRELYAENRRRDDVAIATFNDMTAWELFEPRLNPAEFFTKSWIVDLHAASDTVQRLVVFLLIDSLYAYLTMLPDSEVVEGCRRLRIAVGIDEARKVLGYQHSSLIGLVRESRSKGGLISFMSQSPDDFAREGENFLENLGLGVCFRTNASAGPLNAMLGQKVDLAGLPSGGCVTRTPEHGLIRVKAWEHVG